MDTSQKIGIWSGFALRREGRGRPREAKRLRFCVLIGLGMIFLLSGCGSDSTPKGAASGKKEKAAKSGSNVSTVIPLMTSKEGGTAAPLSAPPIMQVDKIPGMPSLEELEARKAADKRAEEKRDPKTIVLPGITKGELEAKIEAERARKPAPKGEILPGLTMEQLDAKIKRQRERAAAAPGEFLPGLTQEQVKAKAIQAQQMKETQGTRPEQVFPPK